MKILIAPDKFRGSLTAAEVAEAIAEGIQTVIPECEVTKFPLADGGDGTASILTNHFKGELVHIRVHNPVFEIIDAVYGYAEKIQTAFIEMSAASGLRLIPKEQQNPLHTSTLGTGEMIKDAINRGAQRIFLGIGGSATNDAGTGMAAALGYKFLDIKGNELKPAGGNLEYIHSINDSVLLFNPSSISVRVACDVSNPLYGKNGAAYLYSPQKGATPEIVKKLDKGLRNFARVVKDKFGKDVSKLPGAGASGGLGAGAVVFLNASLTSGIKLVMEITGFEDYLRTSNLVITGEGKIDKQTFQGKVVDGVTQLAKKYSIPVLAICGDLLIDDHELTRHGIKEARSLVSYYGSVEQAMKNAGTGIKEVTRMILKKFNQ
ncbi:MAG: hypothetical protein AMS27_08230 [Bacteroides sp. SM23_62_1]|nr:MAG: hypothetical protein AMS27_08230 [Bacteroides sp. SM23_62_1]